MGRSERRQPQGPAGRQRGAESERAQHANGIAVHAPAAAATPHPTRPPPPSPRPIRFGVDTIDLWTLDVEGGELSVLETVDWERLRVGVLVVETDGALACWARGRASQAPGRACKPARRPTTSQCPPCLPPPGKNKTKDAAITSLLKGVGFETVPKVGGSVVGGLVVAHGCLCCSSTCSRGARVGWLATLSRTGRARPSPHAGSSLQRPAENEHVSCSSLKQRHCCS